MSKFAEQQSEVIRLELLRRYLAATGWHKVEATSRRSTSPSSRHLFGRRSTEVSASIKSEIFQLGEPGSKVEVILPPNYEASEFRSRISGVLKTLEIVEERDLTEVIAEVNQIGFDVLRSHLPNARMVTDAVPLDVAAKHIGAMKNLLASAATTEIKPVPYYGRLRKGAKLYSERCLFGHTFRGSFGFTVQSPVAEPDRADALFEGALNVPFERHVLVRLQLGLQQVADAVDRNSIASAIESVDALSANGYDILASLIEGAGHLSLDFAFSREYPAAVEGGRIEDHFEIGTRHVEVARETAIALRKRPVDRDATVIGLVTTLRNETDPNHLMADALDREIQITWRSEDFGKIRVRVALNADDYRKAILAHLANETVAVNGRLIRSGKRWVLSHAHDFRS